MIYNHTYTFGNIDQDTAPDKRGDSTHFNVVNMETYFSNRGLSLRTMKGFTLTTWVGPPSQIGNPSRSWVIGEGTINDRWFIFTTATTATNDSFPAYDYIYEVDTSGTEPVLTELIQGTFGWSTVYPIRCVGTRNGAGDSKLYFIDGLHQPRYFNVDTADGVHDFLKYDSSGGWIAASDGGVSSRVDGVAKYAYSMYTPSESSSKVSKFSDPVTLSTAQGGASVSIGGLYSPYEVIRVYRILWETYNSTPTITLIHEQEFTSSDIIQVIDDGELFLSSLSLEEFSAIGGDYIIPQSISTQEQHLFFGNISTDPFLVSNDDLDMRAYSFGLSETSISLEDTAGTITNYVGYAGVPTGVDAINPDTDTYKYQYNGNVLGLSGENVSLQLKTLSNYDGRRIFKSGETYRIGVQFQDNYERWSNVLWCADVTLPYGPLPYVIEGTVSALPTGAKISKFVLVERQDKDKTVLFQAIPQYTMQHQTASGSTTYGTSPFPAMRTKQSTGVNNTLDMSVPYNPTNSWDYDTTNTFTDIRFGDKSNILLTSPETGLYNQDLFGDQMKIVGSMPTQAAGSYASFYDNHDGDLETGFVSPSASHEVKTRRSQLLPNPTNPNIPYCLLAAFGNDSNTDAVGKSRMTWMFNRISHTLSRKVMTDGAIANIKGDIRFLDYDESILIGSTVIDNTIDYTNFASDGTDKTNLEVEFTSKFAIQVYESDWAGSNSTTLDNFPVNTDAVYADMPLVDVLNSNAVQYNGKSYETKSSNIYIDACSIAYTGVPVELTGDTFYGSYSFAASTGARQNVTLKYTTVYDFVHIIMESSVDPQEFNSKLHAPADVSQQVMDDRRAIETSAWAEYNTVFSQRCNYNISTGFAFNRSSILDYYTRVVPSSIKIPGELIDGWTNINTGTYIDLTSELGPIVKLVRMSNNLVAFQPRGVAVIKVYPTAQTTSSSGAVQLGAGTILDSYNYLAEDIGAINTNAIQSTTDKIFFIDALNKTLNELSGGAISQIQGFNTLTRASINSQVSNPYLYLNDDANSQFVSIDKEFGNVVFQFAEGEDALVYNLIAGQFTHRRTYSRLTWYGSHQSKSYGLSLGYLVRLNRGSIRVYGNQSNDASITMYTEPSPGRDKIFRSITVLKEGESVIFDGIEVNSPYRTSGFQVADFASKFDYHTAFLPNVLDGNGDYTRNKWRVKNIKLLLSYSGTTEFAVDELILNYSIKK
tara:strand:- start:39934 stop:43572 length:3639 start_codon:yes stop_codon:yes gene_type:complete